MKEIILALIAIVPPIATLIVSIITNKKVKKQNDLRQEMQECQMQIQKQLNELKSEIKTNEMKRLKKICTDGFIDVIKGKKKTPEQIRNLFEDFDSYKEHGGDSYVDDLHLLALETLKKGKTDVEQYL